MDPLGKIARPKLSWPQRRRTRLHAASTFGTISRPRYSQRSPPAEFTMIDPEQASILERAQLRHRRIAILRRRRAIGEVRRQIDFETIWADPRGRVAHDTQRRLFYEHCPHP